MSGSQLWLRFSILAASFPALARALLSDPRHSQSHEGWEAALLRAGEVGVRASRYLREMTPDRVRDECREHGVRLISRSDPDYPSRLLETGSPPAMLYARGQWPHEASQSWVAIVGSRSAVATGRRAARILAGWAGVRGAVVVSGLAYGIDGAAHLGALQVGAPTVAVLAAGVERATPRGQSRLYDRILHEGGAVVSEYPPGTEARPYRFPVRNRIIAALAHRVVVVEAREHSGALHTVDHALAMGRPVLVHPADGLRESARGGNQLIQEGAELALDPEDLVPQAESFFPNRGKPTRVSQISRMVGGLPQLGDDPVPVDELSRIMGAEPGLLRAAIARLEILGLVRLEAGGVRSVGARGIRQAVGPCKSGAA